MQSDFCRIKNKDKILTELLHQLKAEAVLFSELAEKFPQ